MIYFDLCDSKYIKTFMDFFRHDGTDSPADAGDVIVVLNSFHSKIIKVRVRTSPRYMHFILNAMKSIFLCSAEVFLDVPGSSQPTNYGRQNRFNQCVIKT